MKDICFHAFLFSHYARFFNYTLVEGAEFQEEKFNRSM